MGELAPPPHRGGPIDDAHQVEALEHRRHQGQGTGEVTARLGVQPGERPGQVVEGSRVLQPIPATEVCHNTVAYLAGLVTVALHDVDVLIDVPGLPDFLDPYEHFPNTLPHQLHGCKYVWGPIGNHLSPTVTTGDRARSRSGFCL